jgi:spore germination protein GerM
LGCLFWIAFILLVIMLFFFNRKTIADVLGKTKLLDGIAAPTTTEQTATPAAPEVKTRDDLLIVPGTPPATGDGSLEPAPAPEPAATTAPAAKPATAEPAVKPESATKTTEPAKPAPTKKAPAITEPAKPVAKPTAKPVAPAEKPAPARTAKLFFVNIDSDGSVIRQEVTREIAKNDSPLSETLNTLFKGPTVAESKKGLRSLIPAGTRLLSATVKDGVAVLNLSEEFQFNQYGIEGYLGQLAQVVFTATSFSTVKSVQFLIDGQKKEYLGAEGIWIGTPLSRDKF